LYLGYVRGSSGNIDFTDVTEVIHFEGKHHASPALLISPQESSSVLVTEVLSDHFGKSCLAIHKAAIAGFQPSFGFQEAHRKLETKL